MKTRILRSRFAVRAQQKAGQTDISILIDDVSAISESHGIERLDEAVVFDPRGFRVLYRGPANDSLALALDEVLAGQPVSNAVVASTGKTVAYPEHNITDVSYSRDVAPR